MLLLVSVCTPFWALGSTERSVANENNNEDQKSTIP